MAACEVTDDRLTGVRLRSGETIPRQVLAVAPRFTARVPAGLGLETAELRLGGHALGSSVPADPSAVPGVWAAGNVTELRAQVIGAAAAGLNAAVDTA